MPHKGCAERVWISFVLDRPIASPATNIDMPTSNRLWVENNSGYSLLIIDTRALPSTSFVSSSLQSVPFAFPACLQIHLHAQLQLIDSFN